MKVYLVEKVIGKKLAPMSIKSNFEIASGLIGRDDVGIVTEVILDGEYPDGIGVCNHWHFPDESKEKS